MEVTWLGHSCFRLKGKEATLITDPPQKSSGYSLSKLTADIVTISHDHDGHNNPEAVAGEPRIIKGPGEYEVSRVLITGIRTYHDKQKGAQLGKNTAYVIEMEDLRFCHLGDLGHLPTPEQIEELSGVDVLLAPVGGYTTLDAAAAAQVVSLLEPKIVIPMHYKTEAATATLDPLDRFLKEMGASLGEPLAKLSVTRSSLPHDTQVVLLEYRRN